MEKVYGVFIRKILNLVVKSFKYKSIFLTLQINIFERMKFAQRLKTAEHF